MQEQNKNRGPERGDCLSLMSDSNVTLLQSTDMLKRIVKNYNKVLVMCLSPIGLEKITFYAT